MEKLKRFLHILQEFVLFALLVNFATQISDDLLELVHDGRDAGRLQLFIELKHLLLAETYVTHLLARHAPRELGRVPGNIDGELRLWSLLQKLRRSTLLAVFGILIKMNYSFKISGIDVSTD